MSEIHPAIQLLVARTKSHPEEFLDLEGGRWRYVIQGVRDRAQGANLEAFNLALEAVHLDRLHEVVMDELLNGDERRRKEKDDIQNKLMQAAQHAQVYQQNLSSAIHNPYLNGLQNQSTYTSALTTTNTLQLGDEKIDSSLIKQIKGKLGL